jgi:hypothetical protein
MLSPTRRILTIAVISVALAGLSANALADSTWQKDHPRRSEVNSRLRNQNKRIQTEVKNGQLSKNQALALHRDDHQIRTEERDMASQNGTHITKQEQNTLNQQENAVSGQIGR